MSASLLAQATQLTKELVAFPSVSHESNEGVNHLVAEHLGRIGFDVESHSYLDERGVKKVSLVAKRGLGTGGVAYLAHTDVVPADDWSLDWCGPFQPAERNGRLYGRGSCDMKGSLAAALIAAGSLAAKDQSKPMYFVVTSDEEVGMFGAIAVNRDSSYFQEMVDGGTVGIVGEPTLLDVIHAHKGGQRIMVRARGRSAHTSTNDGVNANYQLIPALPELLQLRQESESNTAYRNESFDPPTLSWNMTITNEPEAVNVTPSLAQANIFLRSMPGVDHQPLMASIQAICNKHSLEYEEREALPPWQVQPSSPWIRDMLRIVDRAVSKSVCFATDAGILQRLDRLMICGPGDIQQAHRSDEWISLEQLRRGIEVYRSAFQHWSE